MELSQLEDLPRVGTVCFKQRTWIVSSAQIHTVAVWSHLEKQTIVRIKSTPEGRLTRAHTHTSLEAQTRIKVLVQKRL